MTDSIQVGDATADPGELATGHIPGVELTTGDRIDIPVIVLNGVEDGLTALLFSTQHGKELQGTQVIHHLMHDELSPESVSGAVVGIPVANPLAFMHATYRTWIDNRDLGYVSVENPRGNTTERMANAIWTEAWSDADIVLNFHCNDHPDSLYFQIIEPTAETEADLERAAKAFGVTTIRKDDLVESGPSPVGVDRIPTLSNKGAAGEIPELMVEFIDGRYLDAKSLDVGVTGTMNVLREFDVLPGDPEAGPQEDISLVPCRYTGGSGVNRAYGMLRNEHGGLLYPRAETGTFIEAGEVVADVVNLHGERVERVEMPEDGYLWAYAGAQQFATSGGMQTIESGGKVVYAFTHEEPDE
ncbi:succinylglutamate desuccinylase/aspartoacylase family protein [Salinigranum halophilum]|uniref:succinylglutamate desuccinylase/aspartoacylase family protein n=1 Tax=Salinigranum halophilum TaxID=2565931 RepID=UPI0010A805B8|nr:succinylglutamate desuccinylase/aspartoacylase family protein [Salinigranum halophilum]